MITSRDSLLQTGMNDVLRNVLKNSLERPQYNWIQERANTLLESVSFKDFYIGYTLIKQKLGDRSPELSDPENNKFATYLSDKGVSLSDVGRMYLLSELLDKKGGEYEEAVVKLIEVADAEELAVFLKFIAFLPSPEIFRNTAAQALRTNIEPVFDAIALRNPYGRFYFNDQQWNQMYLKAAFMQRPLLQIEGVEERANTELSRIISDYAHERWAASRDIDPHIWRPAGFKPAEKTYADMKYLMEDGSAVEMKAAVLVCESSQDPALRSLIGDKQEWLKQIHDGTLNWNNLKL